MIINRHKLAREDNGKSSQPDHHADSEVQSRAGDMPGRLFILFADHIVRENGDEGRTERAARDNIKDEIGNEKSLQVGIGERTGAKDKGEHRGAHEAKNAAGNERAGQNHGSPTYTRSLDHAGIL